MATQLFRLNEGDILEPVPAEDPTPAWLSDADSRILILDGESSEQLPHLLELLGAETELARTVEAAHNLLTVRSQGCGLAISVPVPITWGDHDHQPLGLVCLPDLLIVISKATLPDAEALSKRLCRTPLAGRSTIALIVQLIGLLTEEDGYEFLALRNRVPSVARKLREHAHDFDISKIENALNVVARLQRNFFDHEHLVDVLRFAPERFHPSERELEKLQIAERGLRHFQDGLEVLERRLKNLHEQYRLDLQDLTERRVRMLTIVSVIFLPLTLIAGIEGMNFEHMPELRVSWGYGATLSVMLLLTAGLLFCFFRKGWFK